MKLIQILLHKVCLLNNLKVFFYLLLIFYTFFTFPFNFCTFSFTKILIVWLRLITVFGCMMRLSLSILVYVSLDKDTFLYLLMSVIYYILPFIVTHNIGYYLKKSMTKFILIMFICSGIAGNKCKLMPTPVSQFNTYHECVYYGYDHSSELIKGFSPDFVDTYKTFTAFNCTEQKTI